MSAEGAALVISALGTAIAGVLSVLVLLLRKDQQQTAKVAVETAKVTAVTHQLVNSQRTEMVARIDQLETRLRIEGARVPPPREVPTP